ncbi:DsbA family oxidoreductase [Laceyella putida]|uniref:DsbA family protein n=1 Tax=Laceyella putida TaxID=110101 RepID=A0ABW2RKG2_9BACL
MIIELFQDIVCPWCRIGKKNLFAALEEWRREHDEEVTIRYLSFLLDPTMPPEGRPFREVMTAKMGNPEAMWQAFAHVTQAGAAVGVHFDFTKIERMPNTWLAHTLMKCTPASQAGDMLEALYTAEFEEGKDVGAEEVLLELAERQGLDRGEVKTAFADDAKREEIEADLLMAKQMGIQGVPFVIIDEKLALSGAHAPANFLRAFAEAKQMGPKSD